MEDEIGFSTERSLIKGKTVYWAFAIGGLPRATMITMLSALVRRARAITTIGTIGMSLPAPIRF